MTAPPPAQSTLVTSKRQLVGLFERAEKPASQWKVGLEAEKFGVHKLSGEPLGYDGEFGVLKLLTWLVEHCDYRAESEVPGGPVIALQKGGISLTLEPGAQFELSAPAVPTTHELQGLISGHLRDIRSISESMGVAWFSIGFHPLARQEQLPWVPKQRYAIMRRYLPTRGNGALDMMRRTATVQGNFDYSDSSDALKKLLLSLRLAPLLNAWLANSPYVEGKFSGKLSARGDVWLRMEPERSGLIEQLWELSDPSYEDYVDWALDAPMFLVRRDARILDNSGQSFRDFMANGFQGERATEYDWRLHVNSLFPEARLKNTLEVRSIDSLAPRYAIAVVGLLVGLLYDRTSLDDATGLVHSITAAELARCRRDLIARGLVAKYGARAGFELAGELLAIARAGLRRRARLERGRDESCWLDPLAELLEERTCPAQLLLDELGEAPALDRLTARLGSEATLDPFGSSAS